MSRHSRLEWLQSLAIAMLSWPVAVCAEPPDGDQLARHVDFVNRFAAVDNISLGTRRQPLVVVDRSADGRLSVNTLQRWRRNDFPPGPIAARDLAIFRSGALRGTGILATDPADGATGRSYLLWLPSLRKIRRIAEPEPSDGWSGSNFSYGDIYTRRPEDESFEVLGSEIFPSCLEVMRLDQSERGRFTGSPPSADCSTLNREVLRLVATPRGRDLGYDRRVIWIDAKTYADYRSEFYRNGHLVKTIDKSWRSMELADPRAQYWLYWFARSPQTGQEGMAYVPEEAVRWNSDLDPRLWSQRTLRQIRR